jgi:hypothetical protein
MNTNFRPTTYMVFGGLALTPELKWLKIHQKIGYFSVFPHKNKFFQVNSLNINFFRFTTHIQTKKSQLAEYDNVEMFTQNFVEVDNVWWVESGLFFSNLSRNIDLKSCL